MRKWPHNISKSLSERFGITAVVFTHIHRFSGSNLGPEQINLTGILSYSLSTQLLCYGFDGRGSVLGRGGEAIFFSLQRASRPPLETTPSLHCVPLVLSQRVKLPWHVADRFPSSNAEFRKTWTYTSTPHTS